ELIDVRRGGTGEDGAAARPLGRRRGSLERAGVTGRLPARVAALTAAAEACAAAAAAARGHRLGLVDGQRAAAVLVTVELRNRALRGFGVGHLHEREPARLTGGAIAD